MNTITTPAQLIDLIASEAMANGNLSIAGVSRLGYGDQLYAIALDREIGREVAQ